MKSLAQLKRDLHVGDKVEMIERWDKVQGENIKVEVPEKMKGVRTVSYTNTTGWYFKGENSTGRGSWCEYPKASELVYVDDTFSIDDWSGTRIYRIYK